MNKYIRGIAAYPSGRIDPVGDWAAIGSAISKSFTSDNGFLNVLMKSGVAIGTAVVTSKVLGNRNPAQQQASTSSPMQYYVPPQPIQPVQDNSSNNKTMIIAGVAGAALLVVLLTARR